MTGTSLAAGRITDQVDEAIEFPPAMNRSIDVAESLTNLSVIAAPGLALESRWRPHSRALRAARAYYFHLVAHIA
jgi:hypothetical protein